MTAEAPGPPPDLHRRALPLVPVSAGSRLFVIHDRRRPALELDPGGDRPADGRFGSPEGIWRTAYLGLSVEACFAETLCHQPGLRDIPLNCLFQCTLTEIDVRRRLSVVELCDEGLLRLGATAATVHGPAETTRLWAHAFYHHRDRPHGIRYRSVHDDSQYCVALFDRAVERLHVDGSVRLIERRSRLDTLLARYGRRLAEPV